MFAAVADAYFTGNPAVVCGTAGPGVTHLFNGLMDALKEAAPVIAIAGNVPPDGRTSVDGHASVLILHGG